METKAYKTNRDSSLDLIRVTALFFVISVHFFYNNGFYKTNVAGERMYVMVLMRTLFMSCVPLFLLLTGCLMNRKRLCCRYYKGISKTVGVYLLASIVCIFFKFQFLGEEITIKEAILSILNFSGAKYAWYVEMYLGLFLLIPFLNLIYWGLESKKEKKCLIITFFILSTLPSILNIFDLRTSGWLLEPTISDVYDKLVPAWWTRLYPVLYYFIGCYLAEFKPKIKRRNNIIGLLVTTILFGTFNYYRSYGGVFKWGSYTDWGGFENVVNSVLWFVLIMNLNTHSWPEKFKGILRRLSDLAFGAYLLSYIPDQCVYKYLNSCVPEMPLRLNYYPIVVALVFIISIGLSYLVNLVYTVWGMAYRKILFDVNKGSV